MTAGCDFPLLVLTHPQKGRALGGTGPLVQIGGVIGRAQTREVQRQHAGRVRAIHQCINPALFQFADESCHRKHQSGVAGDVIEQGQPRARCRRAMTASTTSSAEPSGKGTCATTSLAPARRAASTSTLRQAL